MQTIYRRRRDGQRTLHRSKIDSFGLYADWSEFVAEFPKAATHPAPPENKEDAFGWCPTLFEESAHHESGEVAYWRRGEHVASTVSLFIADLDNQFADRSMIDIDTLQTVLTDLGLAHLLYTSFSHRPERHKVRIVMPVTRHLTPDEAFKVFTWFNYALDYQLDGSVYDPGDFLYGPPLGSDLRVGEGAPLDVDKYLVLADQLPEEAKTFVKRTDRVEYREPTQAEREEAQRLAAITETTQDVTIHNPAIFNPAWFELLDQRYCGGSRHQTVVGLLTKAWLKSGRTLTRGDLEHLQAELDLLLGGYLRRTYGRTILHQDITSVMRIVGTQAPAPEPAAAQYSRALKARLAGLRNQPMRNK